MQKSTNYRPKNHELQPKTAQTGNPLAASDLATNLPPSTETTTKTAKMHNIIRLIRPQQWLKNVFVLLPMFFGGSLLDVADIRAALLTLLAYSFVASSVYCFNDIKDVEADRRHPVKCHRPIASGALSVGKAWMLMLLMLALAALVTALIGGGHAMKVGGVLAFYYVMNLAYCAKLKQYAIVDVCIVAFGFVLRVLAGGFATDIGRAAPQEHHTLQPDVHQPGHHRHGGRHPGVLHHVHGVARGNGALPFRPALPHLRVRLARPVEVYANHGG